MVDGKMFLRVTPILILLVGLTQLSCRTPGDLAVGPPEVKEVRIWVDHSATPPLPRADLDRQHISRGKGDEVEWYLDYTDPAASFEIHFKKTNPLTGPPCPPQARRCNGGRARPRTAGPYAYMIVVISGNERYESDPHIIVDP